MLLTITSCAYYNTFFNAEESYRLGLEKIEKNTGEILTKDNVTDFQTAISKSWKLIYLYGDSNSWADDALLMIGKSHFHLKEYEKSMEVLSDFIQKYLKSPLKTEAGLWLALSQLKLEDTDNAINSLNNIITGSEDSEILSQAYFYLGEIYFNSEDYIEAQSYYRQSINSEGQDIISGKAQYKLADTYFNLEQYDKAKDEYKNVLNYDMPVQIHYDAVVQMTNSLLMNNDFDEAEETLKNLLKDQRFQTYASLIEAKLANMIEFQGDLEYSMIKYDEVIKKYPKSEGSALSQFYLAQLFEFEFGRFDSAKVKYDQVKSEFSKSEAADESSRRSILLSQYINIRTLLNTDFQALLQIEKGDSIISDSISFETTTAAVEEGEAEEQEDTSVASLETNTTNELFSFDSNKNVVDEATEGEEVINRNQTTDLIDQNRFSNNAKNKNKLSQKPESNKKQERIRTKREIEISALKNNYKLAEYFLLTYIDYDSAEASYTNFIKNYSDSLLTPKAYYALYYIYNHIRNDLLKSDTVKTEILLKYPQSVYANKLLGKTVVLDDNQNNQKTPEAYLRAEQLLEGKKYNKAIEAFKSIATADSGSIWAKKSRFAICYIYENLIGNNSNAIENYKILASEYPTSEVGKIAVNKIKDPIPEKTEVIQDSNENGIIESQQNEEIQVETDPEKIK